MMFPTSMPRFTLIHSVLLEISEVNAISNYRFPVLPGDFNFRRYSGEMAKNVTLLKRVKLVSIQEEDDIAEFRLFSGR